MDHLEPVTEHPELTWVLANCRPAHGTYNPCPVCSVAAGRKIHCNQIKAGMTVDRARRVIGQRTGKSLTPPKPESSAGGRDW